MFIVFPAAMTPVSGSTENGTNADATDHTDRHTDSTLLTLVLTALISNTARIVRPRSVTITAVVVWRSG